MDYRQTILVKLTESFRKRKKNEDGTPARKTSVTPDKIYPGYYTRTASIKKKEDVDDAAGKCKSLGFVDIVYNKNDDDIRQIVLNNAMADQAEEYLVKNYGYVTESVKKSEMESLILSFKGRNDITDDECLRVKKLLQSHKKLPGYGDEKNLLMALAFIGSNKEDLYLREASDRIFGSTKMFDGSSAGDVLLRRVCTAVRNSLNEPCDELNGEMPDEILIKFHIKKDPEKIRIKGNAVLHIRGQEIDLTPFAGGFEFSSEDMYQSSDFSIRIDADAVMTVENQTSFLRMNDPNVFYVYLGGYAMRCQRDFLKIVYDDNRDKAYMHFGDIDPDGFLIHRRLCGITGIPFRMFRMSKEELQNPLYKSCLRPLDDAQRKKLESLKEDTRYRETAEYMLSHGVWLEQEIISYHLSNKIRT